MPSATYELIKGDLHRHGTLRHIHPHTRPHEHHHRHEHPHDHHHEHEHGHSHGLVDESIKRSREGVRAVALALAILSVTAAVQAAVFALSGSLALLADLIHNGGDALTAIPLGIAFALRSQRAERLAGLAVVADHRPGH
jgi:Co/Zn/Cd efflux system component